MPPEIREPKQKRAIEKKKKIIEAGLELFSSKGFHNTNTAEIAKLAGVSTGVVYNYFADKKAIFMEAVDIFARKLTEDMFAKLDRFNSVYDFNSLVRQIIDDIIKSHYEIAAVHEEMEAMSHQFSDVAEIFRNFEMEITLRLADIINKHPDTKKDNLKERVHIACGLVENLCHEQVFHRHKDLDYDAMAEIVTDAVMNILT